MALLVLFISSATLAPAQVTIYARFADGTGVWAGESTVTNRIGWLELNTVTFGADNPVIVNGQPPSTSLTFRPLELVKKVDRLTPQLLMSTGAGTSIAGEAVGLTVEFEKVTAAGRQVFFKAEYKLVFVNSSNISGSGGDEDLFETVKLVYGAARYTNRSILPNGTLGSPVIGSWNQVQGNSSF